MNKAALIAFCAVTAIFAASFNATPAYADHAADCAAFAVEAKSLQDASGLWLGEKRMLSGRRKKISPRTPEFEVWLDMNKSNGRKMVTLLNQLSDVQQRSFLLNREGQCPERSAIDAALVQASTFLTGPLEPAKRTLPPGYCVGSPDLSAPLVPCPPKASP